MPRVRLSLLLLAIGFVHPAAANTPIWPNNCAAAATNSGTTAAALSCVLNNVVSGRTIVISATSQSTTDSVTSSGGETVTCPLLALGLYAPGSTRVRICYIVLGSSHATLTITVTATGGTTQATGLIASEIQGLGAVDSSSASGANASSVSTTTAGANEIVFAACHGFSNDIAPGSGFVQVGFANPNSITNQDERVISISQVVAAASTITSACTVTNGLADTVIAALAFSISGAPAPPAIGLVQFAQYNAITVATGSPQLSLHNTSSGNKILIGTVRTSNTAPFNIAAACTETCTCPLGAQNNTAVYGEDVTVGVCYADTTSNHSAFTVTINGGTGAGTPYIWLEEVSGLNSGEDSGAEAAATAATVNYTTATANEWTFCIGGDNVANPMSAGSSFVAMGQSEATITPVQQGLIMSKTTVSSGSNTCSYSITGSTQPVIATMSFGLPATGSNTPSHATIIDFKQHHRKLPWIIRRNELRIETI